MRHSAPTVVPAWWDPKSRKVIFDDSTIVCGVLVAADTGVVFAGPEGIAFEVPAADLAVTWIKMGTGCRLRTPSATRLIYLAPPTDGSPRLSRNALLAINERLVTTSDVVGLADKLHDLGDLADVLEVAGLFGNSLKAVSTVAALRVARRSRQALDQHFTRTG